MKKIYYSKDFKDILNIKKNFFYDNDYLLKQAHKWNKLYSKQPKRKYCKNCGNKIGKKFTIESHYSKYVVCKICGHFNGLFQDTEEFNKKVYSNSSKQNLYNFYKNNYNERCKKIYYPKLNFLKKILNNKKFDLTDFGCGAGHFLKVCRKSKIKCKGYEFNGNSVDLGNKFLKANIINKVRIDGIYDEIAKSETKVISLLGVIEHLKYPNKVFDSFKKSSSSYMFFSVPLSSFTVLVEHAFPNVFPRLLGGVHNNLYTERSIKFTMNKYKFKIIGEWWFGSDMLGLMRSMLYNSKNKNNKSYLEYFDKYMSSKLNDLQKVIDKNKICDEAHIVIKK